MAAGQSRRFGVDCKLSTPVVNGQSMLQRVVGAVSSVSSHVCVVYSGANKSVQGSLAPQVTRSIVYPGNSPGLGDSIAFGVQANPAWGGWIICLADMPYISQHVYQQIAQQGPQHSILAPAYKGRRGHPVFFSGEFFGALTALQGDSGAASILKDHKDRLELFSTSCVGVIQDIDKPADLRAPS